MDNLGFFYCLIAGDMVAGAQVGQVTNPATGSVIASYGIASALQLDEAVASASRASVNWGGNSLMEKRALLRALAAIIDQNADHLARLLTLEQGKPLYESKEEISASSMTLRYYADLRAERDSGLFDERDGNKLYFKTPLGVVAGIIPWNFPLLIAMMKIGPAIITGNTIIIKPAPSTSITTLEFGRLCQGIIPPGVIQFLGDGGEIGPLLTTHNGIRKISFTGSTDTGRAVARSGSRTLKRMTLELGGNDPAIILPDANILTAAQGVFLGAFKNCGQICGAVKRVYVHDAVFTDFCDAIRMHIKSAVVGDGLCEDTTIGPVQNRKQYERAAELYSSSASKSIILEAAAVPKDSLGYFIAPSLFLDIGDESPLVIEEQFCPLLPLQRFTDEQDVIRRANATPYGLTASVWSQDLDRAKNLGKQIDVGMICINKHNDFSLSTALPMSKQSGIGWLFGDDGLCEYVQDHIMIV